MSDDTQRPHPAIGYGVDHTDRGFEHIRFADANSEWCSLQQSSAIDAANNCGLDRPGSSYLWFGCDGNRAHLSREQVAMLVQHMQAWLETGSLEIAQPPATGDTE